MMVESSKRELPWRNDSTPHQPYDMGGDIGRDPKWKPPSRLHRFWCVWVHGRDKRK